MKTAGLLGGMSWESTVVYYRYINEGVRRKLGRLASASILLYSFDFAEIAALQKAGSWDLMGDMLTARAAALSLSGADFIAICTNTMHKVADRVRDEAGVELLNLIDVTAHAVMEKNIAKVGLLGTEFTMTQDFYKDRLKWFGLDVTVPPGPDIRTVHNIIYDELCRGVVSPDSRSILLEIIYAMNVDGIILGCTELPLLVSQGDLDMPVFDTTRLHAEAIVEKMLG